MTIKKKQNTNYTPNTSMPTSKFTSRELLIRIDERQKSILLRLGLFEELLKLKVDIIDLKPYADKTDKMWDDRNKVIGWMIGAGISGGGAAILVQNLIRIVSASF